MDNSDFRLAMFSFDAKHARVLAWSSMLVQKIDLRMRGLVVRKLQVNRHRVAEIAPHRHPHAQAILFLSGEGVQQVGGRTHEARPGDLFVLPSACEHGYRPTGTGRPVCLVLDFQRTDAGRGRAIRRRLDPAAMNNLHGLLSRLPRKGGLALADYAAVAAVVAVLFDTNTGKPRDTRPPADESMHARVAALLLAPANAGVTLARIARQTGYQPDYLTRRLRRESGLGLRQMRDAMRLEAATRALHSGMSVADAASRAGFADPGYFARWFKRHTGQTPREHRSIP